MRLSILDLAPISSNQTAKEALNESMMLAQVGDTFGYTRYWIAEHHDLDGLACSAPEVMLSYIGAHTKHIRIGSGAVLLPHYKPYKVAELYHMLATLFPGRIDIGIGRAPGGSAEATNALSDHFLQNVWKFPELINELLHFIQRDFPADHQFSKVSASPLPEKRPIPWLLGTSEKSAKLAAEKGLAYTFGQFMSSNDGQAIIKQYLDQFTPNKQSKKPQVIVTVSAVCAESTEKAEEIVLSSLIWSIQQDKGEATNGIPSIEEAKQYKLNDQEKEKVAKLKKKMIIGSPKEVRNKLLEMKERWSIDEIMINTVTYDQVDRFRSYELIAKEILGE